MTDPDGNYMAYDYDPQGKETGSRKASIPRQASEHRASAGHMSTQLCRAGFSKR
ncbi:MAG: hypothetical protein JRF53_16700 [Deltaproteobacteria bacterium]|nr:hypothetical protein [Deltaproteobacteria bacterium]